MKKIIAICMAALLLLAALPVSLVLADGAIAISGSVDKAAACAGQEITLTLSIANNPGLTGWNVTAAFDKAAFELVSLTAGSVFPASGMSYGPVDNPNATPTPTVSNGLAAATFADFVNPDVAGDGVLFTAKLKVKADAADGDYEIVVGTKNDDLGNFSNQAWGEFDVNFSNVSVKVGHSYDNACDASCNACGATRDVPGHVSNAAYACQAGKCTECGADVAASAEHTYDNTCDVDCNVCGETRTAGAHVSNAAYACHAGQCTICGADVPAASEHTYTYACDAHCAICGDLTNTEAAHKVGKVDAHDPDCHRDGNVEYWTCAYCGNVWLDEAMTQVSNKLSVIIPAKGDVEVKHVPAKEATVDAEGNIEYWYCEECEQFWTDEALTQLTNSKSVILPKLEPQPTEPTTKPDDTQTPTKPMGENVAVILVSGIIALIAAAAVVLFSKKKA